MEERQEGEKREISVTFSTKTILRVLLVLVVLGFLFFIKGIVAIFFAGLFLAALIDPVADYFEARKIPRGLAALMIYILGIAALAGLIFLVLPPVVTELSAFIAFLSPGTEFEPGLFFKIFTLDIEQILTTIRNSGFSSAVPQIIAISSSAFRGIAACVLTLIFAFYFVVEKEALVKAIAFVTPEDYQPFVLQLAVKMRERLGSWLRGQLVLMVIIFLLTYVVLAILGVPFAIVLALLAGLLEAVPFIGPIISGAIAVIVALAVSPLHAVLTGVGCFMIQSVENALVPKIMQRATGMNPIVSLLAVLIGWQLGGIVGSILSIPLANAVAVFLHEVYRKNNPT